MNSVVIRVLLTSCCFLLCGNAFSQKWIPLGSSDWGEAMTKEVLEDDENSYKVRVILNGLYDKEVTNEHGTFHFVSLGTEGQLRNEGEPSLPALPHLIAIPPGTTPEVSIEDELWEDIRIGTILPAQNPSYDIVGVSEFYIKEDVYRHSYVPQMVNLTKEMNWRGIRNVGLQVCPFKYYPQKDTLSILKEFVLNIKFKSQDRGVSANISQHKESTRFGVFDNAVYSETQAKSNNNVNDNYDYLIIVANDTIYNSQELKDFRRWKALKGYKTRVVTYSSIGGSPSNVKNYISSEYSKGVRYVLLVGDDNHLSAFVYPYTKTIDGIVYNYVCASDYWFGCVQGDDNEQDVAIGRFPVKTFSQFSYIVNKTIKYETWKNLMFRTSLIVYQTDSYYGNPYQVCSDSIENGNYIEPMVFNHVYGTDSSSTNAYVTSLINQGSHIVNYRGHAATGFWGNPGWNKINESYDKYQLDSMSINTNTVFFSIACNSGNILTDTCMLQKFLCSPRGAAAFLGSSINSENGSNSFYDKKLFRNLLDSTIYCYGDLNMKSFMDVLKVENFGNYAIDNAYSYICGGDPTLEIWTANPQKFLDVDVNYANGNMIVKKTDTCPVTINVTSLDGELLNSVTMNTQTVTFPKPANKFYFSLISHNKIPYVVYCDFDKNSLQAVDVDYNGFYANTPFSMGEYVNDDDTIGDVVVKNGSKLIIKLGSGGVLMDEGFRVEAGGSLIIK